MLSCEIFLFTIPIPLAFFLGYPQLSIRYDWRNLQFRIAQLPRISDEFEMLICFQSFSISLLRLEATEKSSLWYYSFGFFLCKIVGRVWITKLQRNIPTSNSRIYSQRTKVQNNTKYMNCITLIPYKQSILMMFLIGVPLTILIVPQSNILSDITVVLGYHVYVIISRFSYWFIFHLL